MVRRAMRFSVILLIGLAWVIRGDEPRPAKPPEKPVPAADPAADDERVLKDAGIALDDVVLLAFLRERSLDDDGRKKLEELVRRLGHDDFDERENASRALVSRGSLAVPFLNEALSQKDAEVARRARECLDAIKRGADSAVPSAEGEIILTTRYRHGLRLAGPGGEGRRHLPLMVAITDNGSGIPESERGKIFDLFYTTKQHGTGLGLPLTLQIIAAHGGNIACEPTKGGGTTFEVWLPRAELGGTQAAHDKTT